MLLNVLQMRVIKLKDEDHIRDVVLYMHEAIIHEEPNPAEYSVPPKFTLDVVGDDNELRGMVRALRWVIEDDDEDLL